MIYRWIFVFVLVISGICLNLCKICCKLSFHHLSNLSENSFLVKQADISFSIEYEIINRFNYRLFPALKTIRASSLQSILEMRFPIVSNDILFHSSTNVYAISTKFVKNRILLPNSSLFHPTNMP